MYLTISAQLSNVEKETQFASRLTKFHPMIERQGIVLPVLGVPFIASALPAAAAAAIGVYGAYPDEFEYIFNLLFGKNHVIWSGLQMCNWW